jgi:rare lipoprotein A
LPFGTKVVVTNLRSGKTVVVRITDRGPYGRGRIIDVSRAAARELDMIDSGTAKVSIARQQNADTPTSIGEALLKAVQLLDPPR